jgi:two-component sensor histidine kinase/FixJ family two-component response regulator
MNTSGGNPNPLLKHTILIIDDEPTNLEVISDCLGSFGFETLVARDGKSGLEKARYARPDIILLDVLMPEMDGFEACQQLKAGQDTCEIPVIFMTALTSTQDKVRGFRVGGVDYITKPFQHEEVLARVQTHLTLRNLRQQLEAQNAQLQREVAERVQTEQALKEHRSHLEELVKERTAELERANQGLAGEVAERKRAEKQLEARLCEREVLLGEIHDRIKNNLQVIISLLHLQERYIQDEQALRAFRESQRRIRSMAFVHEQFYQSPNMAGIDLAGYVRQAVGDLMCRYKLNPDAVKVKVEVHDVFLGLGSAVPCGLLINELVSNCMRHAFAGKGGRREEGNEIRVEAHQVGCDEKEPGPRKYVMVVSDNGVGLPEALDLRSTDSLGLQLVAVLAGQLDGEIELNRNHGTSFKITFIEQR